MADSRERWVAYDRDDYEQLERGEIGRLLATCERQVVAARRARIWDRLPAARPQNALLPIYMEHSEGKRWIGNPFRVVVWQVTGWTIKDYYGGRRYTDPLPEDWDSGSFGWTDEVVQRDYMTRLFAELSDEDAKIARLYFFHDL